MFDLNGRTALITGSGRGVGIGIAEVLVAAGADVLINDLVADRAEAVAAQLGPSARPLVFDVADSAAVAAAVAAAGRIDILVNNAGIPPSMRAAPFRELIRDEWAPYLDVNLYGVLNCVKATIDGMCERRWGRVITISSGSGQTGQAIGVSLYAAGKGAGISFMRHLAVECAKDGVTANTIALGLMARETAEDHDEARTVTARMARAVPVGRLGTGHDAGHLCAYLASDEAGWMTGQTIGLNGGALTS
jgi:NAD(P)-dependent dehydrogenase (short-subunit alcohol dehydrogenase family)